jgi:hypothetical protein
VHVVELSNHPGDMLDDAARRRVAAERRVHSAYEDELVRYRARVQAIKVRRDRARAGHRWWAWLKLSLSGWRERRRVPSAPVPAAGNTDLEQRQRAEVRRLIEHDHAFHDRRGRTRSR